MLLNTATISETSPPMPPRRRLSAGSWERIWWLQLHSGVSDLNSLQDFAHDWCDPQLNVRAKLRTSTRICLAITCVDMTEGEVFEKTMTLLACFEDRYGPIDKIEDRPAIVWPYREFAAN